jgi:hypothetical protein
MASIELILMILKDTHFLFFRCWFTASLNVSWPFIDFIQHLITLKKKDQDFTSLIFGTTELN